MINSGLPTSLKAEPKIEVNVLKLHQFPHFFYVIKETQGQQS